jgi:predicted nucleotidyltransferase
MRAPEIGGKGREHLPVRLARRISLLDVAGIEIQPSELLGQPVDLIEEGTLKPRVRRTAEAEAVRAF